MSNIDKGIFSNSRWFRFVRLLIGFVVLLGIVAWLGVDGISAEISNMEWLWLVWMPVLWMLNLIVGGIGLFALFRPFVSLSLFSFLRLHFFSQSLGAFLPFQLGESSLVLLMRNQGVTMARATGFFLIDKATTLLVLGILGGLGMGVLFQYTILAWLDVGFVVIFVVLILVATNPKGYNMLIDYCQQSSLQRVTQPIQWVMAESVLNRDGIAVDIVMTVVRQLFIAPLYFLVMFNALRIQVPLGPLILIANLTSLVSLIPITAQGLGIVELSSVYLFSLVDITPMATTTIYIVSRPLSLGFSGLVLAVTGPLFDLFHRGTPSASNR